MNPRIQQAAERLHYGQDEHDMPGDLRIGRKAVQDPNAEQPQVLKPVSRRALVVDHDENVLIALERLLRKARCNVTSAQNGLKALQLLWQGTFDLVLLDDNLPDANGEVLARQVRSVGTGTPVVVMQAMPPSDDLAVRYARLGARFFINRRDPAAIAELVHEYFSRPRLWSLLIDWRKATGSSSSSTTLRWDGRSLRVFTP